MRRLACWLAGPIVGLGLLGCSDPQFVCEGGTYRQGIPGIAGPACVRPMVAGTEPTCPETLPAGLLSSQGTVCAETGEAATAWCAQLARERGSASECLAASTATDPSCLAAVSFDGLGCDGLVNLCASGGAEQRLRVDGTTATETGGMCGGAVDLGGEYGTGGTGTRLLADSWPVLPSVDVGFEIRLQMQITREFRGELRDAVSQGIVLELPGAQLTLGLVGVLGRLRLGLAMGRCGAGGDLPALSTTSGRNLDVNVPVAVRVVVGPGPMARLEVAGESMQAMSNCSGGVPNTPGPGVTLGRFPGTVDELVITSMQRPMPMMPPMPPTNPPPTCGPGTPTPMCPPLPP